MRALALILCLPSILHAQDALEIVRRAAELDRRNSEIARNYTYLRRQEERDLDANGRLRKTESTTFDVTLLEGSPYDRLVARNDRPLSPREQQQEEAKLQKSIAERGRESREQHDRRVADWQRKQEKHREPIKEMLDAFTFTMAG